MSVYGAVDIDILECCWSKAGEERFGVDSCSDPVTRLVYLYCKSVYMAVTAI